MAKLEQEPEKRPGTQGQREVFTHPAFGQISVSRVSGQANLYGSDFQHHSYIAIRIRRSQLERSLGRDWHYGGEHLVEVALSEAQWATFVSSFGIGEGVPCTIDRLNNEGVPTIPFRTQNEAFKNDMKKKMATTADALRRLRNKVAETPSLSKKGKVELTREVDHALMQIEQNAPFVARCFDEYVEETIEKAKVEVHGYVNGVIHHAGLKALQQPLLTTPETKQIEDMGHDDHDD